MNEMPPEETAMLRNGVEVRVRPIRPDDVPRLLEFHARLSVNTTRLRFFTAMRRLSPEFAASLCTVDFGGRAAFVISPIDNDEIHAVGRYERESEASAELAFVVEDTMQGLGIGPLLLERLVEHARGQQFERLTAVVLLENLHMLTLFRESPYLGEITMEHDCAFVKLNIGGATSTPHASDRRKPTGLVATPSRKAG